MVRSLSRAGWVCRARRSPPGKPGAPDPLAVHTFRVTEWTEAAFVVAAQQWIREQVPTAGEITQPHVQPWATVMRVDAEPEPVWFKALGAPYAWEPAVTTLVSELSDRTLAPLATRDRWMLLPDAGERLREVVAHERSLARWLDVLDAMAEVQLRVTPHVDTLLGLGVPDRRLEWLPKQYADFVAQHHFDPRFIEATGLVEQLAAELAGYGIPATLQHDDLHDGQVFVKDGRHLIMDWGDSCITHPFFVLAVAVRGNISWGVDDVEDSEDIGPYLDAYLARFGGAALRPAAEIAMRLGWACRAVNGHVPGEDRSTLLRLQMFLDGRVD